ncbi:flotillin [Lachnospiraceae bacterium]|nr:flotillin [Lachnospiraceae bacterium]
MIQLIVIGAIIIIVLVICVLGYVKAPTDQALIISGISRAPKVIIGRSSIRIPFLQRVDRLHLGMLSVDVKTSRTIPTLDYINIMVDSVATVKIGTTPELLKAAQENFLNKNSAYINNMIVCVLEGNLREIIGSMKLTDIMNDRKSFAQKVSEDAKEDMNKMGLEIVSFNIQNISDGELGVIDNLGIANTVAIRQNAEISKANAEKEIAVAQALAKREANDARVATETAIAEKNNELAIKQAGLKAEADAKKAEADAAYEIHNQEQQKTIAVKTTEAEIAKQMKEVELKQQEAAVQEQQLNATIRKQADADKYRVQQASEAMNYQTQQQADAEKYKRIAEAEAKLAEQQKAAEAVRIAGEAEAAAIAAKGKAEAEAIAAKGKAEAEAMDKKAEALQKYGRAAMTQMVVEKLPEMAKAIAEPLAAIDKVTIIDGGGTSGSGVNNMGGYVPEVLAKTIESVRETTGFDLTEVMRANTYDAKTDKNINLSGKADLSSLSNSVNSDK